MLSFYRESAGNYTATANSGAVYRVFSGNQNGQAGWFVSRNGDTATDIFGSYTAAKAHANAVAVLNNDNDPDVHPDNVVAAVSEESGLAPEAAEAVVPATPRPRRRGRRIENADGSPATVYTPAEEAEIAAEIHEAAGVPADALDGTGDANAVVPEDVQFTLIPEQRPEGELANVPTSRVRPGRVQGAPQDLIDSVRSLGILQPLALVRRAENLGGGYDIADGRRRYAAAVAAELGAVPALVFPEGTPAALAAAITLTTNMQRQPNPPSELEAIEQMVHDGASIEQIAQELRLSTFVIRRRMALARLIPEFRAALEDGLLSVTTAQRVARHPDSEQRDLLVTFRETGRVTSDDRAARRRARRGEQAEAVPGAAEAAGRLVDLDNVTLADLAAVGTRLGVRFVPTLADSDAEAERVDPVPAPVAATEAELPDGHGWANVLACLERAEDSVPVAPDDYTDRFYADLTTLLSRVRRIVNGNG